MTDDRPTGALDSLPAWISPELIAAGVGVLVWGSVLASSLLGGLGPTNGSSAQPSTAPSPSNVGTQRPDRTALAIAQLVGQRLRASGAELDRLLAESPIDPLAVETALRDMTAQLGLGADVVRGLGDSALTRDLMTDLRTTYADLGRAIDAALAVPASDVAGIADAAAVVLVVLDRLAAIDERVDAMLAGEPDPGPVAATSPGPSASPVASASPGPSASPSPSPGASPAATASFGPNRLRDPGFESTPLSDWVLVLEPPAEALLASDPIAPAGGSRSARIDISSGAGARAAIALVQEGVALEAGQRYRVTIRARADEPREFRLTVGSTGGETYAARVLTAGTEWTGFELDFIAIVDDPAASVRLELGRSAVTTWFDDASLAPVAD